jgi:TorA maturation chaperone TorD
MTTFVSCTDQEDIEITYQSEMENLWADFTILFGADDKTVNSTVTGFGCSYSFSDHSYSVNGSDYYYIEQNNDYADIVGFVFNTDNQVSQCWVYFKHAKVNDVYSYLTKKYTAAESENTDYKYVFYNDNKDLKIVLDLMNGAVIYTKLDMKQHETPQPK